MNLSWRLLVTTMMLYMWRYKEIGLPIVYLDGVRTTWHAVMNTHAYYITQIEYTLQYISYLELNWYIDVKIS